MSECKKTCGNCAGRIESILSKDRCDMTNNPIEDYSSTCDNWEPNRETEIVMQKDELKSLRQERDELQEQVAVLRGALEKVGKGHIESRFDHEDGRFVEVFVRDVHIVIDQALEQTPADAAERVNALVGALEWIEKTTQDTGAQDAASDALDGWRCGK